MLALYRSARHADALAVYEDFRRKLDDEPVSNPRWSSNAAGPDPQPGSGARAHAHDPRRGPARPRPGPGGAQPRRVGRRQGRLRRRREPRGARGLGACGAVPGRRRRQPRGASASLPGVSGPRRRRSAARAAAWLAYDTVVFRGDDAVAQGWFGHAHRLLRDSDECEEHGWLAFLEGEVALIAHGDAARAAEHAERALDVGRARA